MRPYVFTLIVAFTLAGFGCTSSQTSTAVTAPASVKCQVQVGSAPTSFTADGGTGTLAITTTRDCTWSVATSASWVAIANTTGQGEASVPYTVSSNPVPVPRAAEISVSDATLQVSQAPAPCRYSMSPTTGSVGASGGAFTVQLSTMAPCGWAATPDASWLTITSGASGNASGPIVVSAAVNTGSARTAHVTAGEATFTMTQSAAGSGPAPAPTPPPAPSPPPVPPPARVSGTLSAFSGQCPNVSFTLGTTHVFATGSTVYSDGKCKDLRNGKNATVTGVVQTDGRLLATIIDVN